MIWNNHLFARQGIAPFLMTPGATRELESPAAQDNEYLIRGEPWRPAFTQPSPQRVWRCPANRGRMAQGKDGSLLRYSGALLALFHRPMCNPATPDRQPSSSGPRDRIRARHETSQTQYTPDGVVGKANQKSKGIPTWNCHRAASRAEINHSGPTLSLTNTDGGEASSFLHRTIAHSTL